MLYPVELRALTGCMIARGSARCHCRDRYNAGMPAVFEHDGVCFLYPENWTLERGEHLGGWSVTVQSRDTAFLSLSYHTDQRDMAVLADTALEAMREEYSSIESNPTLETIADLPAVGHDVRF